MEAPTEVCVQKVLLSSCDVDGGEVSQGTAFLRMLNVGVQSGSPRKGTEVAARPPQKNVSRISGFGHTDMSGRSSLQCLRIRKRTFAQRPCDCVVTVHWHPADFCYLNLASFHRVLCCFTCKSAPCFWMTFHGATVLRVWCCCNFHD